MKRVSPTPPEIQTENISTTWHHTAYSETGRLENKNPELTYFFHDLFSRSDNSSKKTFDFQKFMNNGPKLQKYQKKSSNVSHRKPFQDDRNQVTDRLDNTLIGGGSQLGVNLNPIAVNDSDPVKGHCESDAQCGPSAVCVELNANEPKLCWCVHELEFPDPKTGACGSKVSVNQHAIDSHGVIHTNHLKEIVRPANANLTSVRTTNKTSSTLGLQGDGSPSDNSLFQIIPPVVGFFIVVVIILICFFYRRRYLNKHFCVTRNGDIMVRNSDGSVLLDRMNNISKNPTYFCPNNVNTRRQYVKEVSSDLLKLLEVVGEGAFGQVFRGELYIPECESQKQVAVKVLKDGATREAREDFDREVEIMASFDHDNILKLLCVIVQETDGNPYMIFEYMEHGDLSELLRKNDPHLSRNTSGKCIVLNKADLVDVSVQIANGMCYLASQRFVHRDLATRNCLVASGLIVKISDFGMSRDVYVTDYYRIGGSRMLPVRWMSPEAIKYGRFTSESDIWAYGVVLWEIFSYGKQPYYGHSNEEVIHLLDQGILLQRPEECPSTVYHVMLGCWKKDPKERLIFDRLVKYLTEYRNRLMKPSHAHPVHSSSGIDVTSTSNGSHTETVVQEKADAVNSCFDGASCSDASDNVRTLSYLTLADNGVRCDDNCSIDAGNVHDLEMRTCLVIDSETPNVNNLLVETVSINNSSQDTQSDQQNEQSLKEKDLVSASVTSSANENKLQVHATNANQSTNVEPKKMTAKRIASCPLSVPNDKCSENQILTDKQTSKFDQLRWSGKCGSKGRASLKSLAARFENTKKNHSGSTSVLDLCAGMTSITQGTAVFPRNSSRKSAHSLHTKSGNIHHKTNKVNDKSGFSEPHWNPKSQSHGAADCSAFGRRDEGLDSQSAFMQSQREVSVVNEYSIPGKCNI